MVALHTASISVSVIDPARVPLVYWLRLIPLMQRFSRLLAALPDSCANAAGKPAKVALTAVMRKLIVLMNHLLKNPSFSLAH